MANYLWKSTTTPPNLANLANWRMTDASNSAVDLGPATVLPGPADTAYINTTSVPGSTTVGTCDAGTVITYAWMGAPVVIGGGTYSGSVYADYGTSGGIYNGNVRAIAAMGPTATTGGTFNADLITPSLSGGIVNGRLSLNGGTSSFVLTEFPGSGPSLFGEARREQSRNPRNAQGCCRPAHRRFGGGVMSLNSGPVSASSRSSPTVLVNPAAGEPWNYIDVQRDANDLDAEISFDSGTTWVPFPGNRAGWSGPFPKSSNRVLVRPKTDGQSITGLAALRHGPVPETLMADLLGKALGWLDEQCQRHLSQTVTYRRGEQTFAVLATVGQTSFEQADDGGAVIQQQVRDYLIRTADLQLGLPERGDQVIETVGGRAFVYEALPLGDEPCWRYSDPYRLRVRIHTKQVQSEESVA